MQVVAIKTARIEASMQTIEAVLAASIISLIENDIVAISSKIVSLCEGSVVPISEADKDKLVKTQADLFLPVEYSSFGHHFTVLQHTIIASAGIDESNGGNYYVLWPIDVQNSANVIRQYLQESFGLRNVGVVITDSTCRPLRRGTSGIALAHCGFKALRNYRGKEDLFGRPLALTQANIAEGLAATAVLSMGEGAEQTPICIIRDVPNIEFQQTNPSVEELGELHLTLEDDLFAPFLTAVHWERGNKT